MPVAKGPRKGRKPSDPLLDDRVRTGRPNLQRFEAVIAALAKTSPSSAPSLDAFTLLALWRRFRMNGDAANAARMLAALERLAERPRPRMEGEGDLDDTDE